MKAIVDADILCYEFGNMKDLDTGDLLAWPIVRKFVDERIQQILEGAGADEAVYYLTDSKSNYRNAVATILPYKGHRTSEKPPHWEDIRQHLIDNYDAEVQYGIEADDRCGIEQSTDFQEANELAWDDGYDGPAGKVTKYCDTIICSRDKDLSMITGWHYSWPCGNQKERKWFVSEEDGIRFFYKQLLTGDSTDNILGLYRVGEKATCVKALDDMTDELDMFRHVYKEYENRFGAYAYQFLEENATLLWICRGNSDAPPSGEAELYIRNTHYYSVGYDDEEDSEINGDEALVQEQGSKGQD